MSLPEVRAVIARDQADRAAAHARAGELAALATAAATGSKEAAKLLDAQLAELHWLAGHEKAVPAAADFEQQLAGLFGQIGIKTTN